MTLAQGVIVTFLYHTVEYLQLHGYYIYHHTDQYFFTLVAGYVGNYGVLGSI